MTRKKPHRVLHRVTRKMPRRVLHKVTCKMPCRMLHKISYKMPQMQNRTAFPGCRKMAKKVFFCCREMGVDSII